MSDEILLEIVTPEKLAFSGKVEQVTIPGSEGQFGVLKGHTPFLSFVDIGELNFVQEGKRFYYAVNTGYAEVASNKVTVLVETAESADAIDKERALRAKERAQSELSRITPAERDDYEKMRVALMRAVARLNVASKG
ncbi:MAG: ATP synthase F1 subunit epsilon [Syntrophobacteraceae bacterium CG23_combo_of_CG06-09_8_20_14_all_50_8]|nr:MAG: ATP synthase F1 subunit epsilon [Syntrophobacteraceae bacterium CG23_combo_of_CG06-09_8_20_14_all_50_8]